MTEIIRRSWMVFPSVVGIAALSLASSAPALAALPTTVAQPNVGTARMSVLASNNSGKCIEDTANSNDGFATGVESWDIDGGSYTVTLAGVTECDNTGSASQIQVIVLSSQTGNQCLTANCDGAGTCTFGVDLSNAPDVQSGEASPCLTYPVLYCTEDCKTSTGSFAQRSDGLVTRGGNRQESHLRAASFSDPGSPAACGTATEDEDCGPDEHGSCTNEVGSRCCTLSQGCFGAWNSVCNCSGDTCNPATGGTGYLSGSPGSSCLPVTVGSGGNTVTINDQGTLIAELPASTGPGMITSPGSFSGVTDCASAATTLPGWSGSCNDQNLGGTKGQGGGSLTGHMLAKTIAECLGDAGAFAEESAGLGGFQLPATGTLLCTRRSGEDKHLDSGDDVCEAFAFPACVSGLTVGQVQACANELLGTGSNSCGCSESDLGAAMGAIIRTFDGCGEVVACPDGATAGTFDCGTGEAVLAASGGCGSGDTGDVAATRMNADEACKPTASSHGAYVSCVNAQGRSAIISEDLRQQCRGQVTRCAAKSTTGKGGVTCCRTNSAGVTRCSVKSDAGHCVPPSGGSACVGNYDSCCDACSGSGCAP